MKMQAVVLWEPKRATLEHVERPDAAAGEMIVEVKAAGVCGTDLKIYDGDYLSPYPLTPGHEMAGTVASVGAGVSADWVGRRVGVDPTLTCGVCVFCRSRQSNHCVNWGAIGDTVNGGFAEFVAVPAKNVYALPEDMPAEVGALIEPLACAEWALERVPVRPGSEVLMFGMGPMGVILMRLLLRGGASAVTAVDTSSQRLEWAIQLGARQGVLADAAQSLTAAHPMGFDLVVDATGVAGVMPQAIRFVRPGGAYLLFGVAPRGAVAAIEPYWIYHREITIYSSMAINQSYARAVQIAASSSGVLEPRLVTHTFPLSAYANAIQAIRAGEGLKVQLRPG